MRQAKRICGLSATVVAALFALLALAAGAAADSIAVQPDGKIVVIGAVWPQAGALTRLEPDGSLDRGFGHDGFVIDRRLPPFQALALGGDGRIVAVPVGGVHPARYLPDGAPDPTFAGAGTIEEPGQPVLPSVGVGPTAVALLPDGSVVVAENLTKPGVQLEAWLKRYGSDGSFLGAAGPIAYYGGRRTASWINDLLEEPAGSLLAAGSALGLSRESALLARFPSSGGGYDPGFGGGAGLVRLDVPPEDGSRAWFGALAWDGDKIVAAGTTDGSFLVARFAADGTLDPAFGDEGHAIPPIAGPSAGVAEAGNRAADVAPLGDGELLLAGGTSEWSSWVAGKLGELRCTQCPQPLLAAVGAGGELLPGFGNGGVLRLLRPDGSVLQGSVEQAVPLADGKILIRGSMDRSPGIVGTPFLARLNRDGSYDPTFGEGGLTVVRFPCTNQPRPERQRAGCVGRLRARITLGGVREGRPALLLRARSTPGWTAIGDLTLTLPKYMRLTHGFRSKLKVHGGSPGAKVRITPPGPQRPYTVLAFKKLGLPRQLRVRFEPGALHVRAQPPRRGPAFRLRAHFLDSRWATWAGEDEVIRRAR